MQVGGIWSSIFFPVIGFCRFVWAFLLVQGEHQDKVLLALHSPAIPDFLKPQLKDRKLNV